MARPRSPRPGRRWFACWSPATAAAEAIAKDFDGTVLVDDGAMRARYEINKVPYTLVLRGDGTAARAVPRRAESTGRR